MWQPTRIQRSSSQCNYWAELNALDSGQNTDNAHILAGRIMAAGRPVTVNDVNEVLASGGQPVSEEDMKKLIQLTFTMYPLTAKGVIDPKFLELYPRNVPVGQGRWGVYMYINKITGVHYVGSSIVLHERIRHYWKKFSKKENLRRILADIRQYGLENFTLHVYELPVDMRSMDLLLALEQYYILSLNPGNNTLKVAGASPGGMAVAESNRELNRKDVYVYQDGVLLCTFPATHEGPDNFKQTMKVGTTAIEASLKNGKLLYGVFQLTGTPLDGSTVPTMTVDALRELFSKASVASKSKQTMGLKAKGVVLTRVTDNKPFTFKSVTAATAYINTVADKSVSKNMLSQASKSGLALRGFIVTYNTTPLKD